MAAGENLELFGFQFKDYRSRDADHSCFRQTPDRGPGLVQQDVPFERVGCSAARNWPKNISRLPGLPRIEGTVLAHWVTEKVGIHQLD
jgi:hypothetical protein